MKNTERPNVVIIINGDNNKVSLGETRSRLAGIVITSIVVTMVVLAVFFCCPDLLPEFIRCLIGLAVNN